MLECVIDESKKLFRNKKVLFMCDDLWPRVMNVTRFVDELKRVVNCSAHVLVIISTRSSSIARQTKAC